MGIKNILDLTKANLETIHSDDLRKKSEIKEEIKDAVSPDKFLEKAAFEVSFAARFLGFSKERRAHLAESAESYIQTNGFAYAQEWPNRSEIKSLKEPFLGTQVPNPDSDPHGAKLVKNAFRSGTRDYVKHRKEYLVDQGVSSIKRELPGGFPKRSEIRKSVKSDFIANNTHDAGDRREQRALKRAVRKAYGEYKKSIQEEASQKIDIEMRGMNFRDLREQKKVWGKEDFKKNLVTQTYYDGTFPDELNHIPKPTDTKYAEYMRKAREYKLAKRQVGKEYKDRSEIFDKSIEHIGAGLAANTGFPYFAGVGLAYVPKGLINGSWRLGSIHPLLLSDLLTPGIEGFHGLSPSDLNRVGVAAQLASTAAGLPLPNLFNLSSFSYPAQEALSLNGLALGPVTNEESFSLRSAGRAYAAYALNPKGSLGGAAGFFGNAILNRADNPQIVIDAAISDTTSEMGTAVGGDSFSDSATESSENTTVETEPIGTIPFQQGLGILNELAPSAKIGAFRLNLLGVGTEIGQAKNPFVGSLSATGSGVLISLGTFLSQPSYSDLSDLQQQNIGKKQYNGFRREGLGKGLLSSALAGADTWTSFDKDGNLIEEAVDANTYQESLSPSNGTQAELFDGLIGDGKESAKANLAIGVIDAGARFNNQGWGSYHNGELIGSYINGGIDARDAISLGYRALRQGGDLVNIWRYSAKNDTPVFFPIAQSALILGANTAGILGETDTVPWLKDLAQATHFQKGSLDLGLASLTELALNNQGRTSWKLTLGVTPSAEGAYLYGGFTLGIP